MLTDRLVQAVPRSQPVETAGAARPATGGAALAARDLWLSYDGSAFALRGVSVSLRFGEVAMLLGRSGSGKTSLLKALKGLVRPQRGVIDLAGIHENGRKPQQYVAYVPQSLGLVRSMSALENTLSGALSYTGSLRSLVRAFPKSTVEEARETLATLGLSDKLRQRVSALSGGERQRVAIARALMQRPSVILADEFVSQLDPVTADDILEQVRVIAARGVGLLITTHETDVVAKFADRILVMRSGELVHDAPAAGVSEAAMMELIR